MTTSQNIPTTNLHTSDAARRRVKKRYRAQTGLKLAGITAIALAGLALVTLIFSIVERAIPAFSETYITLDVSLDRKRIDPDGTKDLEAIYSASYSKLIRNALKKQFPDLDRSERRQLFRLVSDGAAYELRDHVVANPALIGQTITFDLLADDDVDLFFKGLLGRVERLETSGEISVKGDQNRGEEVLILAATRVFEPGLDAVKTALAERAKVIERQAANQQRAARSMVAKIALAGDAVDRDELLAQKARYEKKYQSLFARVEDLRSRAVRAGGSETLDNSLPSLIVNLAGGVMKVQEISADTLKGTIVLPPGETGGFSTTDWGLQLVEVAEENRKITDNQIIWLKRLEEQDRIKRLFNWRFFRSGDASEPEEAGILGGLLGTFWTMLVTFLLAFPIGVLGAIYLEEFAPKNFVTTGIEVMINNLAAIPSIVFGLLGLAVIINVFGLPYSTSLVGGIVLALMTLPTVIIASRAAIKAVPPSIREAALGIGASRMQMVFQHVLPLAMPGIMTGSILGMAQALGETAPLLMIGMVAFIVDPPMAVTDAASSLPVLIYLWADRAEAAFDMKTAAAILVLLGFLITMNALAILLRKKFERRW